MEWANSALATASERVFEPSLALARRAAGAVGEKIVQHPLAVAPFALSGLLSIATYVVPVFLQNFVFDFFPPNLKKKYNASWGLVTGASSGIGKAIAEKLLSQGVNVVLVALQDKLLDATYEEFVARFPTLEIRKLGVDLSKGDYVSEIARATQDIEVTLVFNNAGFITTGLFFDISLERNMANYECNATSCVKITHVFLKRMVDKKQKGLIAFTSSSAGFVPNPLSAMYASTKAFMTMFASSVAAEVRSLGIDVVVVHPSPVASNFFENAGGLSTLIAFKRFAASPMNVADVMFASAGRTVVRDQGLISILFRCMLKFVDSNFFCELAARGAHLSGDHRSLMAKYWAKQSKA